MTPALRLIPVAACVAALAAAGSVQAASGESGALNPPASDPSCKRAADDVLDAVAPVGQPQPVRRATANGPAAREDFKLIYFCPAKSDPTT